MSIYGLAPHCECNERSAASFASTEGIRTIDQTSMRRRSQRAKMHGKTVTTMDLEGTQVTHKP